MERARAQARAQAEAGAADDPSRAKPDNELRISFGSANEENIRKGIARLGKVLKKFI